MTVHITIGSQPLCEFISCKAGGEICEEAKVFWCTYETADLAMEAAVRLMWATNMSITIVEDDCPESTRQGVAALSLRVTKQFPRVELTNGLIGTSTCRPGNPEVGQEQMITLEDDRYRLIHRIGTVAKILED